VQGSLTIEWVVRIVDAARELVAAHERRAADCKVPTLAERQACARLLAEVMANREGVSAA
jgi:hypothetical protein